MALDSAVATAEGESEAISLRAGSEHMLRIRNSAAWGGESVAIEISANDTDNFDPLVDTDGNALAFTANGQVIVHGGFRYRMNVTGYNDNDITMTQQGVHS